VAPETGGGALSRASARGRFFANEALFQMVSIVFFLGLCVYIWVASIKAKR
jgi:hypothetical protein